MKRAGDKSKNMRAGIPIPEFVCVIVILRVKGYPKVEDAQPINKRMDQLSQNTKQEHRKMMIDAQASL